MDFFTIMVRRVCVAGLLTLVRGYSARPRDTAANPALSLVEISADASPTILPPEKEKTALSSEQSAKQESSSSQRSEEPSEDKPAPQDSQAVLAGGTSASEDAKTSSGHLPDGTKGEEQQDARKTRDFSEGGGPSTSENVGEKTTRVSSEEGEGRGGHDVGGRVSETGAAPSPKLDSSEASVQATQVSASIQTTEGTAAGTTAPPESSSDEGRRTGGTRSSGHKSPAPLIRRDDESEVAGRSGVVPVEDTPRYERGDADQKVQDEKTIREAALGRGGRRAPREYHKSVLGSKLGRDFPHSQQASGGADLRLKRIPAFLQYDVDSLVAPSAIRRRFIPAVEVDSLVAPSLL